MIEMEEKKEKLDEEIVEDELTETNETNKQSNKESKKEKKNKLKEENDKLTQEVKNLKENLLRNAAELENFKKRINQERIQDRKYASKHLIFEILTPLDQLSKIVNMKTDNDMLKNFLIGFKMVNDQLFNVLETDGVKEIDALHKPFDPKLHYAIEKVSDETKDNGINLEVIQKGYTYKEQLLRPAMVKVNEWSEENGKDE
jgi:molecular chaperone GrpE